MGYNKDCEECIKLWAERTAKFSEYQSAKDELALTSKKDVAYFERNVELKRAVGRLREAAKRQKFHEEHCRVPSTNK
jgi:hypothetical protein